MTRVLALGTFDLFHAGHVAFLKQARGLGDHLAVAVNTDEFAARFKRAPIIDCDSRYSVIRACRYVDQAFINEGAEDARWAIRFARADIVAHGDDWTGDAYKAQLGVTDEWLTEHGIEIRYLPYGTGAGTSGIIDRILTRATVAA